MSIDPSSYDEILPERARRLPSAGYPTDPQAACAGDTIEVACPECGGSGYHRDERCGSCDGGGGRRVLLTEDPAQFYTGVDGWRHVGTVVSDA